MLSQRKAKKVTTTATIARELEALTLSSELAFSEDSQQVLMHQLIGNHYHIIQFGKVPDEIQERILGTIQRLHSSRISQKTYIFYAVKHQGEVKLWVGLSGFGSKKASIDFERKLKNPALADLKVEFIPYAESSADRGREIAASSSNSYDELNRIQLFDRFLLEAFNCLGKEEAQQEFGDKFNFNQEIFEIISQIKIFYRSETLKNCIARYKEKHTRTDMMPMELMLEVFFKYHFLDFSETLKFIDYQQWDLKTGKQVSKFPWQWALDLYNEFADPAQAANIMVLLNTLWETLKAWDNFTLSEKLAHCAENNLIEFLEKNKNICCMPGEHYIFAMNAHSAETMEMIPFCGCCVVNVVPHLKELFETNIDTATMTLPILPEWPTLTIDQGWRIPYVRATEFLNQCKEHRVETADLIKWVGIFNGRHPIPDDQVCHDLISRLPAGRELHATANDALRNTMIIGRPGSQ